MTQSSAIAGKMLCGYKCLQVSRSRENSLIYFYRKEKHIFQLRVRMGNSYWKFLEKGKTRKGQLEWTMTRQQTFQSSRPFTFYCNYSLCPCSRKALTTDNMFQGNFFTVFGRSELALRPPCAILMQEKRRVDGLVSQQFPDTHPSHWSESCQIPFLH